MGRIARRRPLCRALPAFLAFLALLGGTLAPGAGQEVAKAHPKRLRQQPTNPDNPLQSKKPRKPAPAGGDTAAEAAKGPRPLAAARRVLVLSLDGAGSEELHQLYRDGVLSEDGFDRFFKEGEVADALVPVDPALTAPNHVSLATGYPPSKTGIVGNRFVLPGAPWFTTVSGFEAPIATETLWEAARRQKKKVGVLAWPGADGKDARRRGDWGLTYVNVPEIPRRLVTLTRGDWKPATLSGDNPKITSYSPPLVARVELTATGAADDPGGGAAGTMAGTGGAANPAGPGNPVGAGKPAGAANGASTAASGALPQSVDLVAIDRTDDGKTNYDALLVLPRPRPAGVPVSPPFGAGEWTRVAYTPLPDRVTSWIKLLAIDPDLAQVRLYFGGAWRTPAYGGDFARALADGGGAWPGPPDDDLLAGAADGVPAGGDLTTWSEQAARFAHFFFDALQVASERRDWELLLAYVPSLDEAGHALSLVDPRQPGFSPARRDSYAAARHAVWEAVDRGLRRLLSALDLSRTTVVVVSDHGMAPVVAELDANARLRDHGALVLSSGAIDKQGSWAVAVGDGGVAHVYLAPRGPASAAPGDRLADLEQLFGGWKVGGEAVIERVLRREQAAALGLDHPASGDLILFARPGYAFSTKLTPAAADTLAPRVLGMHGYLSAHPEMRAIYLALGAGIKPGQGGTVQAAELAARVAGWLGIKQPESAPPPSHR
jgi:predicted AlkP superfamily pyrophosphatase or phosphodiesterase